MDKTKICSECKVEKPMTKEYFYTRKISKDGFRNQCKTCVIERSNNYYEDNKEEVIERVAEYYKNNTEKVIDYNKRYYGENKERISKRDKLYYENNRDYYQQYRDDNKEYKTQWKKENRNHLIKYRQLNINKSRAAWHKYIAKKRQLPNTLTNNEWDSIVEDFGGRCAYCGIEEDKAIKETGHKLHREHFIPLSKGGGYTHSNIIPSCRSCNSSKRDSDFSEWYLKHEHYSEERERFILEYLGYKNNTQQLSIL